MKIGLPIWWISPYTEDRYTGILQNQIGVASRLENKSKRRKKRKRKLERSAQNAPPPKPVQAGGFKARTTAID